MRIAVFLGGFRKAPSPPWQSPVDFTPMSSPAARGGAAASHASEQAPFWRIALVLGLVFCVPVEAQEAQNAEDRPAPERQGKTARIVQFEPNTSYFDVFVDGGGFGLLLPEVIEADGLYRPTLHTIRGTWKQSAEGVEGTFSRPEEFDIAVKIQPRVDEVLMSMTVKNTSQRPLKNVRANVCTPVNCLRKNGGWANENFVPATVEPDRYVHGKYWYRKVTPKRLHAWTTDQGWVGMHAFPDDPDPGKVARYFHRVSHGDTTRACAVPSLDGKFLFYQLWDTPSKHQSPFHGNACMHLRPFVASVLEPGQSATIRGLTGITTGSREELTEKIQSFCKKR